MSALVLRPYQLDLVEQCTAVWESGVRALLLQMAAGSGKTATASEMIRRAIALGYRVVFAAHLDALIDDTYERLERADIRAGYVQAGRPSDPTAAVQVCSLQTLHSRGERPPADLVILDEAHRAGAPSVRAMLDAYPNAALLGLSATPQRGDGKGLDVFERLIQGPSSRWLTTQGYLVPYDLFAPPGFHERERDLAADPVVTYLQNARGKRALVFAASVAHAESLTREFNRRGCPAACVTGTTSRTARRSARERMRAGDLLIIVGVGVFIEGWDEPTVEAIIFARRFGVLAPWIQGNGRGLRPAVGKSRCTIFDLVGNVLVHGLPDDLVEWSLEGAAFRRVEVRVALRHCKECLAVFRPQAQCPSCGARVTNTTAPKLPLVLRRAERLENYVALPQSERDARYIARLQHVARHRVRVPEWRVERWALERFQARFARLPEMPVANDNDRTQLPELPAANDNGLEQTPRKENAA